MDIRNYKSAYSTATSREALSSTISLESFIEATNQMIYLRKGIKEKTQGKYYLNQNMKKSKMGGRIVTKMLFDEDLWKPTMMYYFTTICFFSYFKRKFSNIQYIYIYIFIEWNPALIFPMLTIPICLDYFSIYIYILAYLYILI